MIPVRTPEQDFQRRFQVLLLPGDNHGMNATRVADVFQRIPVQEHQVRCLALANRAERLSRARTPVSFIDIR